jgi:putative exporter of polyketide antibiotics
MGQNVRMIFAILAAISIGLALAGITYVIAPNKKPVQMLAPQPEPGALDQLLSAATWMGIAIIISIAVVGVVLLVNRTRTKKHDILENQD